MEYTRDYTIGEVDSRSPHLPTAAKWLSEEWGVELGYDLSETMAWCADLAEAEDETVIVATRKDRLIGTILVVECDLEDHEHLTPWISGFYVPVSERGKSIGETLNQAACDWARQKGHATLYLYALKGRLTAFYERLGWAVMSEFARNGQTFQVMQRPLLSSAQDA